MADSEIGIFVRDGFGTLVWCQPQQSGGWRCGLCNHRPIMAFDGRCPGCKAPVYREMECHDRKAIQSSAASAWAEMNDSVTEQDGGTNA